MKKLWAWFIWELAVWRHRLFRTGGSLNALDWYATRLRYGEPYERLILKSPIKKVRLSR